MSDRTMDIQRAVTTYAQQMLTSIDGIKALLLDDETAGIIGLVSSQTEITKHDVYLVERLKAREKGDESQRHIKAIVYVRPTAENTILLRKELASPSFGEYYIYFSNTIRRTLLEDLADADVHSKVVEVKEYFADVYSLMPHLFHLKVNPCVGASRSMSQSSQFERVIDGLFAVLLALKKQPVIRFDESSPLCRNIAERLSVRIDQERNLFNFQGSSQAPLLLLLDRKEDPVTPLLNQWTYEAMTHELLTLKNNRVVLTESTEVGTGDVREVVLDQRIDDFYRRNMFLNFGELGDNVKHLVDSFQVQHRSTDRLDTIDDMMKFVENYPEFKKTSHNVSKHVTLLSELSKVVDRNRLLDVSELEQDIACRESAVEHKAQVLNFLKSYKVTKEDKLKLVLLYSLRYERAGDMPLGALIQGLYEAGLGSDKVSLVNALTQQAGASARRGDVFNNQSFLAKARSSVKRGFGGVTNVYTQHEPLLAAILDDTIRGRLRLEDYPVVHGTPPQTCREVVVFIAGGATYEESKCVAEINGYIPATAQENSFTASARAASKMNGTRIILGGSTIHNSASYLQEIAKKQTMMSTS